MAEAIQVFGPARVWVNTGASFALESLGFSVNGVKFRDNGYFENVIGDANGGESGPPVDVQYFGQVDTVEMELSKWDSVVAAKIFPRLYGGTAGVIGIAGLMIAAGSFSYRLLINPSSGPRNYLRAIPREAMEHNKGTKYSILRIVWECHAVNGVLWNTYTGSP